MSRFYRWAQKEYSLGRRIAALLPVGIILFILLPYVVVVVGPRLDQRLGLESFQRGWLNYLLGGVMIVMGLFFGFWSVDTQMTRGRGTPLPIMPTQELLTEGPFRYCRNPMTFGTILIYVGLAILAGTFAGLGIVLGLSALLLLYIKRVEESELAERFGEAYLAYKREVPFLLPFPPKQHRPGGGS